MSVRLSSNNTGDVVCRSIKRQILKEVFVITGIRLEENQTMDQLVRSATKAGAKIELTITDRK